MWLGPDACNYKDTAQPERGPLELRHDTPEINATETDTTSDNKDALKSQQSNEQRAQESKTAAINRKDFTEGAGPSKASTSALKRKTESIDFIKSPTSRKILCKPGAELLHHGNKTSSCSVDPVHIKEEKPCLNSGVKSEAQARTDCNQVSDSIGAELLHHGNKTSSCSVDPVHIKEEKPCLNSGVKSEAQARTDCNQVSDSIGTVDLGNKSTLEKAEKKKRSTVKCIRSQDGNWFTLQEFELKGGVKNANWKTSVRCNGRTLKWLMEENFLPQPPRIYGKIKKLENAEKCKICWEEGKFIYCCVCLKGFHGDCHLPPVESQRAPWRCTFCTIEFSSRSQQQCYSESEVLARQMGPNDKSKCEFLLLKAYCHFETNVFPNIPHENYVQKASQCLETLRRLDEIKNSLKGGCYAQVEGFVLDMNNIYQDPKQNDSDLIKEEFKMNFKQIFAIQEANQNSSLV
ncbi:nuclear body protein SP140-like protein isoform X2 [Myotis myotis]|uniref:nuclear body protein SP140-like protein isoform X2 n=1 Tax=Myotis myotis TaxID=51298 RepID=UPI00174A9877|nr:nuclear body protein SP140-like protein isoform X2 [Myotis myotis]